MKFKEKPTHYIKVTADNIDNDLIRPYAVMPDGHVLRYDLWGRLTSSEFKTTEGLTPIPEGKAVVAQYLPDEQGTYSFTLRDGDVE